MFGFKLKKLDEINCEKIGLSDDLSDEKVVTVYGGCSSTFLIPDPETNLGHAGTTY